MLIITIPKINEIGYKLILILILIDKLRPDSGFIRPPDLSPGGRTWSLGNYLMAS